MDFKDFLTLLPDFKSAGLPADKAHALLSPPERMRLMQSIDFNSISPREAAVMLLVYPRNDKACFVLILRNSYEGVHSSQMALPGGKKESFDLDFGQTALRETHEEVGIEPDHIQIVRELSAVYIPPSNFMVHPFLGISQEELIFKPDPREVAGIVEVSLDDFLSDSALIEVTRPTSYATELKVPAFRIDGHIVWGATAMILSEFKEVIKTLIKS
ncbi:NUDIX hydrolase [Flavobacterium silvaticum]|uniref:CoA pyrophosphatase n=1 Tax=Flavobacterium silvaticum TaxID=1852020 RepID=A0A972FKN3_9FLAO|nr:CoA pyrophosphatase [Flavobacterium silvaticum]NMH27789.1 CoA pyrophosphatase [Flavobacterium silvaticum]